MPLQVGNTTLVNFTNGGIFYNLMEGHPTFNLADDGSTTAVEKYVMLGTDLQAFYLESIPPPVIIAGFISRPPKRACPGAIWMFTKTISATPLNADVVGDPFSFYGFSNLQRHALYVVTINYDTVKPEDRDEEDPKTFLEHSVTVGGEYLSLPAQKTGLQKGDLDVDPDPEPDPDNPDGDTKANENIQMPITKTMPHLNHHLKWKFVVKPNWDAIQEKLGTVNQADIVDELIFEGFNIRRETLMFMGVSGSQRYLWDGEEGTIEHWDLDFTFSQRYINEDGKQYGWNHVYAPDSGEFERVFTNNGEPLHALVDFDDLFKSAVGT